MSEQAAKALFDAITGSDGTITRVPLGGEAVRQAWDVIERPEHYASLTPEPLDVIESWQLGFHEGNVVKYVARWRRKGGVQDLRKAAEYLRRLIELAEREDAPT